MNRRIHGVIGIKSIMANWNADFGGYPKSISTGEIFGSDKALKYPMKKMWDENGEKVLYIKSLKEEKVKKDIEVRPRTLKERYEYIFDVSDLKKENDTTLVYKNLFNAIDVKNFGATFAEEGKNISIIGCVQFGQGFNKYKNSYVEEQQILSPFRDPKAKEKSKTKEKEGEDARSTTLGTKIVSNEAHYFYPFVINPKVYKEFIKMGFTDGYKDEDYKAFKEVALVSATAYNSNSKIGCENELAIFIETKEDVFLPDITQYIEFEKTEEKDLIKIECKELIEKFSDKIINIEIYYNPLKTKITQDIKKAKYFNIFTREEV